MNLLIASAVLLLTGLLLGIGRRLRDGGRGRGGHIALMAVCALALWFTLHPPKRSESFATDALVVLTPGITAQQLDALQSGTTIVALPGVAGPARAETVADLGSALRAHPGTRRLLVVGGGLPARDRDAAAGLDIRFDAAPLPRGLVEWTAPDRLRAGAIWHLRGRVAGVESARIELLGPDGTLAASAPSDAEGRFELQAVARVPGRALFELRVVDRDGAVVETLPAPLVTVAGDAPRVLVLAGAPDPGWKYLRRWAVDAGLQLRSRITLTDGIAMHDGETRLDAENLARTDLLVVDERSWAALDAAQGSAVRQAVGEGLGVLLRVSGPLPAAVAAEWKNAFGIDLVADDGPRDVHIESARPAARDIPFTRIALSARGTALVPLLRAADGAPLAVWHAQGRGRVAAWWLRDAWRLRLAGEAALYGSLWSSTLARIARARGEASIELPADARIGERAILCGLAGDTRVLPPSGPAVGLVVDPHSGDRDCAGYWPASAGWHTVVAGAARIPFRVRATGEAPGLARAATRDATRLLAGNTDGTAAIASRDRPMPRWPFFLAWLVASAALWWIERRLRVATAPERP